MFGIFIGKRIKEVLIFYIVCFCFTHTMAQTYWGDIHINTSLLEYGKYKIYIGAKNAGVYIFLRQNDIKIRVGSNQVIAISITNAKQKPMLIIFDNVRSSSSYIENISYKPGWHYLDIRSKPYAFVNTFAFDECSIKLDSITFDNLCENLLLRESFTLKKSKDKVSFNRRKKYYPRKHLIPFCKYVDY